MFESTKKEAKRSAKGFTLIELLVVVVIVGILAAVALPNFLGQTGKARTTEATAAIDSLKSGQEAWLNDNGSYRTIGSVTPATGNDNAMQATVVGVDGAGAGALTSISADLGANLDSTKFSSTLNAGTVWVIATQSISATDYSVGLTGGVTTTTGPLRGLASSYRKGTATGGRVWIDGNSTL